MPVIKLASASQIPRAKAISNYGRPIAFENVSYRIRRDAGGVAAWARSAERRSGSVGA